MSEPENPSAPPPDAPNPNPATLPVTACEGVTAAGTPCRSLALLGSAFCFWHTPGRAAEAGRKGAEASHRRTTTVIQAGKVSIDDTELLKKILSGVVGGLTRGELAPARANSLINALRVGLSLAQVSALEKRIAALEEKDQP